jgi:hypothetical protein
MKLTIESVDIHDIRSDSKTHVKDHVLYVNLENLKQHLLKDPRLASVDTEVVRPGDRVRIVNLMDVVQPRCKIDAVDADFPGFVGRLQIAGQGRTRSLRGVAVLVSNPCTKRKYSAFLDMSGVVAGISKYAKMKNLSISPYISEGTKERDFEDAVKIAGLKTAIYLAQAAAGHPVDKTEVFELDPYRVPQNLNLPRVAYYYQLYSPQHDHQGISDPCFYGTDVRDLCPILIHPNEILDGGVVGHHTIRSLDTFTIQNHAVVKELYRRHGKELNFVGVVCGVAVMEPIRKLREAMLASKLVVHVLGADGVILTKIHGGLPHIDLAMVAEECEKLGVKTTLFVQPLVSQGTLSETALFSSKYLDAIIDVGATQERILVSLDADRILGGTEETHLFNPDPFIQRAGDKTIDTEEFLIAGIHDHLGGMRIIAAEY